VTTTEYGHFVAKSLPYPNHGIDLALDLKFLNKVLERRAVFDCIMRDQKVPPRFFAYGRRMGAPDHGCCRLLLDGASSPVGSC
jgi:hypothetical protein